MKKTILTITVILSLTSTGFSYGIANQVSSSSFSAPVLELAS